MSENGQQRDEKTWVEGLFIYEHTFLTGGSVLNCSVDVPRLIAWLNEHKDEAGRVKFKISKKREANKAGTHSAYLDTPEAGGEWGRRALTPGRTGWGQPVSSVGQTAG